MRCSTCLRRVAIIPQVGILAILAMLVILATFPLGESRKTRVARSMSRNRGNLRGNSRSASRGRGNMRGNSRSASRGRSRSRIRK